MDRFREILAIEVGANTVYDFLVALGVFVGLILIFRIFQFVVVKRLKSWAAKTRMEFDDTLVQAVEGISAVFYIVVSFYIAIRTLVLPEFATKALLGIFIVVVVYEGIRVLQSVVDYFLVRATAKNAKSEDQAATIFNGLKLIARLILWSTGILLILSNLGVNITSLVASLGIGGIAVALAAQNILSDIFSSFSIYFDKPFEIGDYIVVGSNDGIVRKIGLKTTRLETLQGEELIISNQEITAARVQNFKKMRKRRVLMNIGVTYDTTVAKMKKAKEIITKSIENIEGLEFSRCYFMQFGEFSLNFEVVFYVLEGEYEIFASLQEEVNLKIKEGFEKAKIEMAFPTQTINLNK